MIQIPDSEPRKKIVQKSSAPAKTALPTITEEPVSSPGHRLSNSTMMSAVSIDTSVSSMNVTQLLAMNRKVQRQLLKASRHEKARPLNKAEIELLLQTEAKICFHDAIAYLILKSGRKFCGKCQLEFLQFTELEEHNEVCSSNNTRPQRAPKNV